MNFKQDQHTDDKTVIFTYGIPSIMLLYLYNLLFSNRPQIKNLILSDMSDRSLSSTKIICNLETDNNINRSLYSEHITEMKEIDSSLDESFEMLDNELNANKINVSIISFIMSASPFVIEVTDNFKHTCFTLNLNLHD